jgi:hypothetical protein
MGTNFKWREKEKVFYVSYENNFWAFHGEPNNGPKNNFQYCASILVTLCRWQSCETILA